MQYVQIFIRAEKVEIVANPSVLHYALPNSNGINLQK